MNAGLVLDRQNGSALFGSKRKRDRLLQRRRSNNSETRVHTLVSMVQVVTLPIIWALMNGAELQFSARFTVESRRADTPICNQTISYSASRFR